MLGHQNKHHACISIAFFTITLLAITPLSCAEPPTRSNPAILEGVLGLVDWFNALDAHFDPIIAREGRLQLSRKLQRLSNDLSNLQLDKEEFADSLLDGDQREISRRINDFRDSVRRLKRSLTDFTAILPPEFQRDGVEVQQSLRLQLVAKGDILEAIQRQIGSSSASVDRRAVATQIRQGSELIGKAREKVDQFLSRVNNPQSTR
jgi:hypothetical protein